MDGLTCDSESSLMGDEFEIDTFAKLCQRFEFDFIVNPLLNNSMKLDYSL